jgi:hypothetical protein
VLRQGQLLTPEVAEKLDEKLTVQKAKQRFREGRQNTAREIKQARQSGVVAGFKPLVSANDCDICQAVRDKFFPVATCTPEMLPPYENCEIPEGCRATFTCTLSQESEELLAKTTPGKAFDSDSTATPKSKQGCLGIFLAVCTLTWIIVWVAIAS